MAEQKTGTSSAAKKSSGLEPVSAETQAEALRAQGVSPSADTASGIAARGKVESPAHDNEGGPGAAEIKDNLLNPGAPTGAQTEPALFVASGSIPHASVPSPTGLVPAAVAGDAAEAALKAQREGLYDAQRGRTGRYRISEDFASRMTPAELRAVATDRGYDIGQGGRRVLRQRFLEAQRSDESLVEPPEGSLYAGRASVTVPGPTGADASPTAEGTTRTQR